MCEIEFINLPYIIKLVLETFSSTDAFICVRYRLSFDRMMHTYVMLFIVKNNNIELNIGIIKNQDQGMYYEQLCFQKIAQDC